MVNTNIHLTWIFFSNVMQEHSKWSIFVMISTPVSPFNYVQVISQQILSAVASQSPYCGLANTPKTLHILCVCPCDGVNKTFLVVDSLVIETLILKMVVRPPPI
ncbi:unnamed protein product [Arctogadus glacialis]